MTLYFYAPGNTALDDTNWQVAANWWTDPDHSTPHEYGDIANSGDTVMVFSVFWQGLDGEYLDGREWSGGMVAEGVSNFGVFSDGYYQGEIPGYYFGYWWDADATAHPGLDQYGTGLSSVTNTYWFEGTDTLGQQANENGDTNISGEGFEFGDVSTLLYHNNVLFTGNYGVLQVSGSSISALNGTYMFIGGQEYDNGDWIYQYDPDYDWFFSNSLTMQQIGPMDAGWPTSNVAVHAGLHYVTGAPAQGWVDTWYYIDGAGSPYDENGLDYTGIGLGFDGLYYDTFALANGDLTIINSLSGFDHGVPATGYFTGPEWLFEGVWLGGLANSQAFFSGTGPLDGSNANYASAWWITWLGTSLSDTGNGTWNGTDEITGVNYPELAGTYVDGQLQGPEVVPVYYYDVARDVTSPYYWGDWNTLGNWWNDSEYTVQATRLPVEGDTVVVSYGVVTLNYGLFLTATGLLTTDYTGWAWPNDTGQKYYDTGSDVGYYDDGVEGVAGGYDAFGYPVGVYGGVGTFEYAPYRSEWWQDGSLYDTVAQIAVRDDFYVAYWFIGGVETTLTGDGNGFWNGYGAVSELGDGSGIGYYSGGSLEDLSNYGDGWYGDYGYIIGGLVSGLPSSGTGTWSDGLDVNLGTGDGSLAGDYVDGQKQTSGPFILYYNTGVERVVPSGDSYADVYEDIDCTVPHNAPPTVGDTVNCWLSGTEWSTDPQGEEDGGYVAWGLRWLSGIVMQGFANATNTAMNPSDYSFYADGVSTGLYDGDGFPFFFSTAEALWYAPGPGEVWDVNGLVSSDAPIDDTGTIWAVATGTDDFFYYFNGGLFYNSSENIADGWDQSLQAYFISSFDTSLDQYGSGSFLGESPISKFNSPSLAGFYWEGTLTEINGTGWEWSYVVSLGFNDGELAQGLDYSWTLPDSSYAYYVDGVPQFAPNPPGYGWDGSYYFTPFGPGYVTELPENGTGYDSFEFGSFMVSGHTASNNADNSTALDEYGNGTWDGYDSNETNTYPALAGTYVDGQRQSSGNVDPTIGGFPGSPTIFGTCMMLVS